MKAYRFSKGSITVFLALILSLVVTLIGTGIDSVRMAAARTQILNSLDIGLYSLFGQYDRTLLEDYDLFALDAADGNGGVNLAGVCDRMETYIKPVLRQNSQKLKLVQSGISGYRLMTDESGEVFYQQIVSYMKETLGIHGVQLLLDKMGERKEETRKAEERGTQAEEGNVLENYDSEIRSAEQKSREAEEAAAAQQDGQTQEISDGTVQNPPAATVQAENPIPAIRRIRWMGLLELVLPAGQGVSDKKVSRTSLVSERRLAEGMAMTEELQKDAALTSQVLYQQYLMDKLGNYREPGEGSLSYQIEYILGGKRSDEENLKSIARKLLFVREGVNIACLAADPGKMAQAAALAGTIAAGFLIPPAAAVIEAALVVCWAFGESILDVRELFAGGKIPLVKTAEDWQISLENLPGLLQRLDTDRKTAEEGMSYEDYLQVFLLASGKKNKVMRGMDMVEGAVRAAEGWEDFRLDCCITDLEASVEVEANGRKTFTATRQYGYQ